MLSIIIDGIELPIEMIAGFSQDYEYHHNSTTHRCMDGTPYRQSTWKKLTTNISGSSWIPSVIQELDYDHIHEIKCASPISKTLTINPVTDSLNNTYAAAMKLPVCRQEGGYNDIFVFAYVDNETVPVTFNVIDDAVVGVGSYIVIPGIQDASYYIVTYQPIINALIDPPKQSLDSAGSVYSWSITAMEV